MIRYLGIVAALCVVIASCPARAGEEPDVQALRAEMAALQAELHGLRGQVARDHARNIPGSAENVTSLRKNAAVTLGGTVNTRYYYRQGEVRSKLNPAAPLAAPDARAKREDFKHGDLTIADAKMTMKIDVSDSFDAFLKLDLQDGVVRADVSGVAENYWIRWKNICNSGFGVLVGRDALKYGDDQPIGILDSWNKDAQGSFGDVTENSSFLSAGGWNRGDGMFAYGNMLPAHTTYNWTRTTQINPYWESHDGRFRVDVSLLQSVDRLTGQSGMVRVDRNGRGQYRSINYGLGSAAARVQWKPVEGLKLTASAMNLYARKFSSNYTWAPVGNLTSTPYGVRTASSNTSVNFAFQYRPSFVNRLNLWAQWTHGWNEAWVRDQDADSANFGLSFDLTDSLTFFAQGDYLRTKNSQSDLWHIGSGWAFYTGAVFTLPYGVNFETGWRHETVNYKGRTLGKHTVATMDTVYAHLGFDF